MAEGTTEVDLSGVFVLVIEDEADSREAVRRLLKESGAQVAAVASAPEALTVVETVRPSVIVSDIAMQGMDGFAFLERVRQIEEKRGRWMVPALALTAYGGPDDVKRAMSAGFQRHVAKPFDAGNLLRIVAELAGRF